jgi:hypothetical protein
VTEQTTKSIASQLDNIGLQPLVHMEEPDVGEVKKRERPVDKGKAMREIILSSRMPSRPSSSTNVASVERWAITGDLA